MARADQAGSFGPSRTRTSLVVYRIAVAKEGETNKAVSFEVRPYRLHVNENHVCLLQPRQKSDFSFSWCFHEASLLGF